MDYAMIEPHCTKYPPRPLKAGGRLNIEMSSCQYSDPHVKDKKVSRPSYL